MSLQEEGKDLLLEGDCSDTGGDMGVSGRMQEELTDRPTAGRTQTIYSLGMLRRREFHLFLEGRDKLGCQYNSTLPQEGNCQLG